MEWTVAADIQTVIQSTSLNDHGPPHPLAFPTLQLPDWWTQLAIHWYMCVCVYRQIYVYVCVYVPPVLPIADLNKESLQKHFQIPKAALHKQIHHHLCILLKCYHMLFLFQASLIKSVYQLMTISEWNKLAKIQIFAWPQTSFSQTSFNNIKDQEKAKPNLGKIIFYMDNDLSAKS